MNFSEQKRPLPLNFAPLASDLTSLRNFSYNEQCLKFHKPTCRPMSTTRHQTLMAHLTPAFKNRFQQKLEVHRKTDQKSNRVSGVLPALLCSTRGVHFVIKLQGHTAVVQDPQLILCCVPGGLGKCPRHGATITVCCPLKHL